jgi:hypothetical protein
MTLNDKEKYVFELKQKLEQKEGNITIEMNDSDYYLVTFEWISKRGYYYSTNIRFLFPFRKLINVQRSGVIVISINCFLETTLDSWKKNEKYRIDNLQSQLEPKYNQHSDVDPFNEEIW